MKRIALQVILVFLVVTLAACTLEIPSAISATAEKQAQGAPVKTWTLTETQTGSLVDWFKQHRSGWSPSYVSYAPRLQVRMKHANGKESYMNVLPPGLVVVVSTEGQFTQTFETQVVEQLVSIIGGNGG